MNQKVRELTKELVTTMGATEDSLHDLLSSLGLLLPEDYLEFMRYSNGAEGPIGDNAYISIWPIEEIRPLNKVYAEEGLSGLLLFASDGGNTAYAFDLRSDETPIVGIDMIGTDSDDIKRCGTTFREFLEYLIIL